MKYERLTTDKPINSAEASLNFAIAKDNKVVLRFAGDEEDKDLCEYLFEEAKKHDYNCVSSAEGIMQGDCLACDCIINVLYISAVQAAELHARLKMLEDKIENGELVFSKDCSKCKYENNFAHQFPCSHCCYCYTGKFEPKENK